MKQKSEQYLFYRLLGVIFQRKETITDLEKAIQRTPEQLPFLERSLYPLFLRFGYDIMEDNRQADRTELIFYIQTILTDFDRLTEDKYFDKLNIKGREKYLSEWKACTQRALQLGIEF
jgi:acetyl-CoA carboxylase alpha subunit